MNKASQVNKADVSSFHMAFCALDRDVYIQQNIVLNFWLFQNIIIHEMNKNNSRWVHHFMS